MLVSIKKLIVRSTSASSFDVIHPLNFRVEYFNFILRISKISPKNLTNLLCKVKHKSEKKSSPQKPLILLIKIEVSTLLLKLIMMMIEIAASPAVPRND